MPGIGTVISGTSSCRGLRLRGEPAFLNPKRSPSQRLCIDMDNSKYRVMSKSIRSVNLSEKDAVVDYSRRVSDERNQQMTYFACAVFKQLGPVEMAEMELVEECRQRASDGGIETVWYFRKKEPAEISVEQHLKIEDKR